MKIKHLSILSATAVALLSLVEPRRPATAAAFARRQR
jgi:hypothetical protein